MTTLTVDTDGVSGTYSSLSAAIAALPATFDDDFTIECSASTGVADTTGVTLPATGSYELIVKPASGQEHNGVWNTSIYRLETADERALGMVSVQATGTHIIDGLQIRRTTTTAHSSPVVLTTISMRTGSYTLRGCIVRGPANASYRARTIQVGGDGRFTPKHVFVNNIIYDNEGASSATNSVFYTAAAQGTGDVFLYSNTIIGGEFLGYQLYREVDQQAWKFVNNIITTGALGNNTADCIDAVVGANYNAFSEAIDFGGANDRQSQTFSFTDSDADDYSLTSDDTGALNHGTDLSADADYPFNTDIVGTTRTGTWDIGAFEFAVVDTVPMPQYIYGA